MLKVKHNTAGKPWPCEHCADPILPGQPVQMLQPFRRPAIRRHANCPTWRFSERETSEAKATAWRAVEDLEDARTAAMDTVPDDVQPGPEALSNLVSAIEDGAATLREAAEMHRESASNLESGGFTGTAQIDEFNEWADEYDGWADEWESHASDIDYNVAEDEEVEAWIEGIDSLIEMVSPS
jgi:hypothetical protein